MDEKVKLRQMLKALKKVEGTATDLITYSASPKTHPAAMRKFIKKEIAEAGNIKSRSNRARVTESLRMVAQSLIRYDQTPKNGLIIFSGADVKMHGKREKLLIKIEPKNGEAVSFYRCDRRFHTEEVIATARDENVYGFIVIDGKGALFGLLENSARKVLGEMKVHLPNKHSRGGQSAARFERNRQKARRDFMTAIGETAVAHFINNNTPICEGLFLAGTADLKDELERRDVLDPRLQRITHKTITVASGGRPGFVQAIKEASGEIEKTQYRLEQNELGVFLEELKNEKAVVGPDETLEAFEREELEVLIVWELTPFFVWQDADGRRALTKDQEKNNAQPLIEWLENAARKTRLVVVTDSTPEGSQFVKAFDGVGGILHFSVPRHFFLN